MTVSYARNDNSFAGQDMGRPTANGNSNYGHRAVLSLATNRVHPIVHLYFHPTPVYLLDSKISYFFGDFVTDN